VVVAVVVFGFDGGRVFGFDGGKVFGFDVDFVVGLKVDDLEVVTRFAVETR